MTVKSQDQAVIEHTEIGVGNITDAAGVAVGAGATAVRVDALGDIGDVVTGTKISIVNRSAAKRVASRLQVSAPPVEYIERPEDEKRLADLLTADYGEFHIVYLYGLPGAGKSWLARKVVSGLQETFADGILTADLTTTNIRTAVWKFIEPYDENISRTSLTSASDFTAAMQAAFGDQRILIMLDHLQDWRDNWQEMRDWLPEKCRRCVMLFIAHQPPQILADNESMLRLSGMTGKEALAMFTQSLRNEDGSIECDDDTMMALAEKLDYIPGAIKDVARDINVKLVSPEDYLEALTSWRNLHEASGHALGLESVFENLPDDGQALLPFLGILRGVPWTTDDLFAVVPETNSRIEIGVRQLKRAGLIDSLDAGTYRTPGIVSEFAMHKLREVGGQPLVEAAMTLRSADTIRKAELILRYAQQSMLGEIWENEDSQSAMIESISRRFSGSTRSLVNELENSSLATASLDPLQEFFEDFVLTEHPYVQQWLDMLQCFNFQAMRRQLEDVFDWAVEKEDWPLVQRFAQRVSVNSAWLVNMDLARRAQAKESLQLGYNFALIKNVRAEHNELVGVTLKGSHIKSTTWSDSQFVAMEWRGVHVDSSIFANVDMVGMIMPGSVVSGCIFTDVDARYGDFRGTIFQQCAFEDVNFRAAHLENAKFIDCNFKNVDFRLTVLEDSLPFFNRQ